MTRLIAKQDIEIPINIVYEEVIIKSPGYYSILGFMEKESIRRNDLKEENYNLFLKEDLWEIAKPISCERAFEDTLKFYELAGCITRSEGFYMYRHSNFDQKLLQKR